MEKAVLSTELGSTVYPGRGIVAGLSGDGQFAVIAYFIMGRSANSRNRVFVTDGSGIRTQAFDESKMEDPSLIIYDRCVFLEIGQLSPTGIRRTPFLKDSRMTFLWKKR